MHKNDSTKGFFSEDRKIIIGVMWLFQILVFGPMLFDEITLRKFIVFILAVVTAAPFLIKCNLNYILPTLISTQIYEEPY